MFFILFFFSFFLKYSNLKKNIIEQMSTKLYFYAINKLNQICWTTNSLCGFYFLIFFTSPFVATLFLSFFLSLFFWLKTFFNFSFKNHTQYTHDHLQHFIHFSLFPSYVKHNEKKRVKNSNKRKQFLKIKSNQIKPNCKSLKTQIK